ncbi:ROK family transcriptional regulator [Alkalicoccobacillus gibsonii]|uniref:ROK family transcriptional regulator n=1 Tax=Alkalicoccobacillus gibsonii TaxID=79881 RepID=UPI003F7B5317
MSQLFSKLSREQMKTFNQKVILKLLKEHGVLSKAQLSKISQLTVPAVTGIIQTLLQSKLIEEIGPTKTSRGRFPATYKIRSNGIHILAVTIATTFAKAAIINLDGEVKEICQTTLPKHVTSEQALSYVEKLVQQCNPDQYQIIGMGAGLHGIVDTEKGVLVFPPQLSWRSFPILEELEKRFSYPILIDNDCNTLVLAERWFGQAKEGETTVTLNVDYGIGAGIYMNNNLFRGSHYAAGQIGHTIVAADGLECPCGNRGCLEMHASEPSIIRDVKSKIESGSASIATDLAENVQSIQIQHVYEAALLNDELAISMLSRAGALTGKAASSLVNILNPDRLILSGGILKSNHTFFEPFQKAIQTNSIQASTQSLEIVKSDLGTHADVIGAACLWIDQLFDSSIALESIIQMSNLDD